MMPMNQQNFNFIKNNPMNPQVGGGGGCGPMNNSNQMILSQGSAGNNFQSSCDMNNPDGNMWGPGNQQMNMDPLGNGPSLDPSLLSDPIESLVNDPLSSNSIGGGSSCMDPTSPNIPSLQGVKVPDEDLTPQQRHQRAMKLAQLQELKQMFKQEHPNHSMNPNEINESDGPIPSGGGGNSGPPCSKNNVMMQNSPAVSSAPGMMNNPHPHPHTHGPMNAMNMNGPMRPNFPPGMGPRGGMVNMNRPPMGMNHHPDEMMGPGMNSNNMAGPSGMMHAGMQQQHMHGAPNMGSCMMPGGSGGMMGQKNNAMMGGPPPGNMHMQDWNNKMQQQYYEENKRNKGPMPPQMGMGIGGMDMSGNEMHPGGMPGGRMQGMRNMPNMRGPQQQGPPPPYHQTPRSASVPIATQSPNPNSPNNPTSNLSLPSPRGGSTLNSPAAGDPSRMNPQFKHMNHRQSPTAASQDSPAMGRQINHSNPSTPISSHLSPSASRDLNEMSTNPSK